MVEEIAWLDCIGSLVEVGRLQGYVRPSFRESPGISITDGRHPLVEQTRAYVPNSIEMSPQGRCCIVITGPNMGGKSTLMRQVALIQILAQIGAHVPCKRATLGVCDSIWVRMGASDSLMHGRSTFMVELEETAEILKAMTPRSLVLLDELGRGTSTHDGCAIAYATLRQLINAGSLSLFSTHYPALTEAAKASDFNPSVFDSTPYSYSDLKLHGRSLIWRARCRIGI